MHTILLFIKILNTLMHLFAANIKPPYSSELCSTNKNISRQKQPNFFEKIIIVFFFKAIVQPLKILCIRINPYVP